MCFDLNVRQVLRSVLQEVEEQSKVDVVWRREFLGVSGSTGSSLRLRVRDWDSREENLVEAAFLVNTAGLYADRVAREFGVGQRYRILPFKGDSVALCDCTTPGWDSLHSRDAFL